VPGSPAPQEVPSRSVLPSNVLDGLENDQPIDRLRATPLYQYFPDKRAILVAVRDRHVEEMASLVERKLRSTSIARCSC
jgi:hypothetical protein